MRKPPVEHVVHKHLRKKRPVRQYHRGSGKPPKETPRLTGMRTKPVEDKSHGGFDVKITYAEGGTEKGVVKADKYQNAVEKGIGIARKQVSSIFLRQMEL